MPKPLKVISINFPFRTAGVEEELTFATDRALFDFDVVVVRPYLLAPEAGEGTSFVSSGRHNAAQNEIGEKLQDIWRLLQQGGLLIVILDAVQELKYRAQTYTASTVYTVTNYDFLGDHFFECVRNGRGRRLEYHDNSNPFVKVLKNSLVEWTAFLAGQPQRPFDETKFFASNGAGANVGGIAGHVIFLPNFTRLDEDAFFAACAEYGPSREATPEPPWVKDVPIPGIQGVQSKLSGTLLQLKAVEASRDEALRELSELLSLKKLLYQKGKTQLEPIVRRSLDLLGFKTLPGETITGTLFEIDGRTTQGSVRGILEIKGSKNQISLDEFSPFVSKVLADFQVTKRRSKGILVGNGLCLEPPKSRVGGAIFSPHTIEAAKTNSVALVNTVELYALVCGLIAGEQLDLPAIREVVLAACGHADLRAFCASFLTTM